MRKQIDRRARPLLAGTLLAAASFTAMAAVIPAVQAGEPDWVRQFGTRAVDYGLGVTVGPQGRVHVVGSTGGRFGIAKGDYDALVITFDRAGAEAWRRQPGTSGFDFAHAVATDANGNVFVVGNTAGALGGPFRGGESDAFLIKFDRDGRTVWKRQPGSSENDEARGVAVDADGNVAVVGLTFGSLGGSNRGSIDAFMIKFDRDGRTLWKRQPGGAGDDAALAVAADADGNIYVAGETTGSSDPVKRDAWVTKYDRDGRTLWKRQPGTAGDDAAYGVATDAVGNVYLAGYTEGSLGGPGAGSYDAFVIKFDRDGQVSWKRQAGTERYEGANAVAADADGNVAIVGTTYGPLAGANKGGTDAFVIRFDRDGGIVGSDQPGTRMDDGGSGVATDGDGTLYVSGWTSGSLPGNVSQGSADAFLIKYGFGGPQ